MTQLVKKAREIRAKIEEYMLAGEPFDDAYDMACNETEVKNYVINQINGQLERWTEKDGAAIVDGIVVASFDELTDLMRWMLRQSKKVSKG